MSKYPAWWDSTLTIYNKYVDPATQITVWYRWVVDKAFWKYTKDKFTLNDTVLESNKTICRIRQNADFIEKYLWNDLTAEEKVKHFTLGQGDIIVKGEVNDSIDEYHSGTRSTDLIAKYKELQGCLEIETVSINVGAGRCLPHYLVQGV